MPLLGLTLSSLQHTYKCFNYYSLLTSQQKLHQQLPKNCKHNNKSKSDFTLLTKFLISPWREELELHNEQLYCNARERTNINKFLWFCEISYKIHKSCNSTSICEINNAFFSPLLRDQPGTNKSVTFCVFTNDLLICDKKSSTKKSFLRIPCIY